MVAVDRFLIPEPRPIAPAPLGLGRRPRPRWEGTYATCLALLDGVAVTIAAAVALLVRFGTQSRPVALQGVGPLADVSYGTVASFIAPGWVLMLLLSQAYDTRSLLAGSEEPRRVVNASVRFAALIAFASFALQADLSRAFVGLALPLGVAMLLLGRVLARATIRFLRRRGRCLHRVVAVGGVAAVTVLTEEVAREPAAGFAVVATALPDVEQTRVVLGGVPLPDLGPARDLAGRLSQVQADTVAVAGDGALSSRELRELSWQLEGSGVDLVVAPSITDVAGPRISIRPVAGLPLLHVEEPTFSGVRRTLKTALDLSLAVTLLVLLVVPGLLVAAAVKLDSAGPVFYRQVRVGRDGRHFRIWKFRTMVVDADRRLAELAARNEHDGVLFKIRADPRVTRVGRVLRKYSLDEAPQLLNVLFGTMSLVGPRPPLPREVEQYEQHVRRRLLVKPGMTGLWQVNGRADLAWDEAVRLDLYYVENWSVSLDLLILLKTARAVVHGRGAY